MPRTFTMRDPAVVIEEQRARAARNQAAYKARKDAQAAHNAAAVKTLFKIVMKLASSPAADITPEDEKILNEIEARLK